MMSSRAETREVEREVLKQISEIKKAKAYEQLTLDFAGEWIVCDGKPSKVSE